MGSPMRRGGEVIGIVRGVAFALLALGFTACEPEPPPGNDGGTDAGTDAGVVTNTTDIALVRFDSTGAVDTTFGDQGVRTFDFGDNAGNQGDGAFGLAVDGVDRLVIFANAKAATPRVDGDRVIARLTADGDL